MTATPPAALDLPDPPCWTCWSVAQCTGYRVLKCRWCTHARERREGAATDENPRKHREVVENKDADAPPPKPRTPRANGKPLSDALWTAIQERLPELCADTSSPVIPRAQIAFQKLFREAGEAAPPIQAVRLWVSQYARAARAVAPVSPPDEVPRPDEVPLPDEVPPAPRDPLPDVAAPSSPPPRPVAVAPPGRPRPSMPARVVSRCVLCERDAAPFLECPGPFQGLCYLHRAQAWKAQETYALTPEEALTMVRCMGA